jgi:uncharacterized protein
MARSNFQAALQDAKGQALVGPQVIRNALPYVGGGLVLTAVGTYGGLSVIQNNPGIFFPTFIAAIVVELILYFVVAKVAENGNKSIALPMLTLYSLLSGYTLSGLVYAALRSDGVGLKGVMGAALGCGITFIIARQIGSNMSDQNGQALSKTIFLGMAALFVVCIVQFLFSLMGFGTPTWLEIGISGVGVMIFMGCAVVDFYVLPRTYRDDQYLPAALSMYLTYINLFIFMLRLLLSLSRSN